ncbi:hypothetical protein VTK73DRAFT_6084 [Phialemonium thermophilum]|uniref:Uncharacterized protein n=1 Tax=Phialemonium thermophilum TaxID=223376 RepID=A0ABR3V0R3_9PEZI
MDVTLALLPWAILKHLTMNRKEKTAVSLAMSMGADALRYQRGHHGHHQGHADLEHRVPRHMWVRTQGGVSIYLVPCDSLLADDGVELVLWGSAEPAVTIVAASLPILRALLRPAAPHVPELETKPTFASTAERAADCSHADPSQSEAIGGVFRWDQTRWGKYGMPSTAGGRQKAKHPPRASTAQEDGRDTSCCWIYSFGWAKWLGKHVHVLWAGVTGGNMRSNAGSWEIAWDKGSPSCRLVFRIQVFWGLDIRLG